MDKYYLAFELESDTTFGRGDGVAGMLNQEVQHDIHGFPYISGKTLKGILVNSCADVMESLRMMGKDKDWNTSALRLFGKSGSTLKNNSILHIGDATLPEDLRNVLMHELSLGSLSPDKILNAMTSIRYQTAINREMGVALKKSLRAERVILKGMYFESALFFLDEPSQNDLELLAAVTKAFYRAGSGVSRGRGKVKSDLLDANMNSILENYFALFKKAVIA